MAAFRFWSRHLWPWPPILFVILSSYLSVTRAQIGGKDTWQKIPSHLSTSEKPWEVCHFSKTAVDVGPQEWEPPENIKKYYCNVEDRGQLYSQGFHDNMETKFLYIGRIKEQLSKSILHMAEILTIAKATKRVLVLPRVGTSRVGSRFDYLLPFCSYFSSKSLGKYVKWVSEKYFFEEILPKRNDSFTIGTLLLKSQFAACDPLKVFCAAGVNNSPVSRFQRQLEKGLATQAIFGGFHSCLDCGNSQSREKHHIDVENMSKFNVLVVTKCEVHPCMSEVKSLKALSHVIYSENLQNRVSEFQSEKLGRRFLGMHWRTERLLMSQFSSNVLEVCKNGLIETVRTTMLKHKLKTFFFAADLSPTKGRTMSSSFSRFEKKGLIVEVLQEIFEELQPVTWEKYDPKVVEVDSGISGILDKLTLIQAEILILPPPSCVGSRKGKKPNSSFVREILSARKRAGLSKKSTFSWSFREE